MTTHKKFIPFTAFLYTLLILFILFYITTFFNKNIIVAEEVVNFAEQKKVIPKTFDYPFKKGEKLHYGIYSAGIKVGSATIAFQGTREIDGQLISHITLEASAPGFYDLEKIYGNIEKSLPIRIERQVRLFGKDIDIIEVYDQSAKQVKITRKSKAKEAEAIQSQDEINNIILLLYQFRYKQDYKIGDTLKFNLPTKRLEVLIDSEKKIKVPEGSYQSIFIRSIPPRFKVWFRKDKDRIPLRIQGAIGFGNTYMQLLRVEQP